MFDSNRPSAAEMRIMRGDAARVRAQHQTETNVVALVDDTTPDLHGPGCTLCTDVRQAVAS